jgi:hypothetical protein
LVASASLNYQASSGKISKKKAMNLSSSNNNHPNVNANPKLVHQPQISLNNISVGLGSQHGTIYGNLNNSK